MLNKWIHLITPVFQMKNTMSTPPVSKASSNPDTLEVYKALSKLQRQELNIYKLKKDTDVEHSSLNLHHQTTFYCCFILLPFCFTAKSEFSLRIPDFNKKHIFPKWHFQWKLALDWWKQLSEDLPPSPMTCELFPQDPQSETRKWSFSRYPLIFTYTTWHVCPLPHNK